MEKHGYPTMEQARDYLRWAERQNSGPWTSHCQVVARAAGKIAQECGMHSEKAYIMGLLHDIGRYEGVRAMHHTIAGYALMHKEGFEDIARICLTHSFPVKALDAYSGKQDCTEEEKKFLAQYIDEIEYDDYDKLIQICDAISLPSGVVTMDARLIDVTMRHGVNEYTISKWKAFYALKKYFDTKCQKNIYELFRDEIINDVFA